MRSPKAKKSSNSEIYLRASSFCAYQERTQQEVRDKLYGEGVNKDVIEETIVRLIEENFLNEERFAKAYAGGKFRMKKWGRLKIKNNLKRKGLSDYCIRKGMQEIEEKDYEKTLEDLLEKKSAEIKVKNRLLQKNRLSRYLIGKGYEAELVWEKINEYLD